MSEPAPDAPISDARPSDVEPAPRPGTCPACPHDLDAHDRLGVRFCAATADLGLTRGCICVQ